MMSYWAEFAYSGSPGRGRGGDLPEWPAWDDSSAEAPKYIVFDTPADGGLRLASETFTVERVVAELMEDPRLASARDRCAVLRNLTEWRYLSREQYAAIDICGSYAYDAYPWPTWPQRSEFRGGAPPSRKAEPSRTRVSLDSSAANCTEWSVRLCRLAATGPAV